MGELIGRPDHEGFEDERLRTDRWRAGRGTDGRGRWRWCRGGEPVEERTAIVTFCQIFTRFPITTLLWTTVPKP